MRMIVGAIARRRCRRKNVEAGHGTMDDAGRGMKIREARENTARNTSLREVLKQSQRVKLFCVSPP
jgi:hypothetical protein